MEELKKGKARQSQNKSNGSPRVVVFVLSSRQDLPSGIRSASTSISSDIVTSEHQTLAFCKHCNCKSLFSTDIQVCGRYTSLLMA